MFLLSLGKSSEVALPGRCFQFSEASAHCFPVRQPRTRVPLQDVLADTHLCDDGHSGGCGASFPCGVDVHLPTLGFRRGETKTPPSPALALTRGVEHAGPLGGPFNPLMGDGTLSLQEGP